MRKKETKKIQDLDNIALKKELIITLKKSEVFYQKYKESFNEIKKVQLLLFSVRKKDMKKK